MTERDLPDIGYIRPDAKGFASEVFGRLAVTTANNFPEPQFWPRFAHGKARINPFPFEITTNADGTGTKPELVERLYTDISNDPEEFDTLGFDISAMIESDAYRDGFFPVAIVEVVDTNWADPKVIVPLANGIEKAASSGRFAVINGETAELGHRTGGYGATNINWNAFGISICVPEKEITGDKMMPGQPLVAFREKSIRSNGLSKARQILTVARLLEGDMGLKILGRAMEMIKDMGGYQSIEVAKIIHVLAASTVVKDSELDWHKSFPEIVKQLKIPSTLYGPVMYDAQGGVFGEQKIKMTGAAHITGGGIPLKGSRMVKDRDLGLSMDAVFPDPEGITSLLELSTKLNEKWGKTLIDDRTACDNWNRGIGFVVSVENEEEAKKLIDIAANHNVEAAVAGEIIDKAEIQFRNHIWRYLPEDAYNI